MDSDRFDDLTRSLTAASRRNVLAGLVGGLLVVLPLAPGGENADAKKKKRKRGKKRKNRTNEGAPSTPPPPPCQGKPDFTACGDGLACSGGVCAAGPPQCYVGFCSGLELSCCGGSTCSGDCFPVGSGAECNSTADCTTGLTCVGFKCQN